MDAIAKVSKFLKNCKRKSPQTTLEKIKLVKRDLNAHRLPKSDKKTILKTIAKAELALNRNMDSAAETIISQAKRDIKKAIKKKKALSQR